MPVRHGLFAKKGRDGTLILEIAGNGDILRNDRVVRIGWAGSIGFRIRQVPE
jgi:hypothetical protein